MILLTVAVAASQSRPNDRVCLRDLRTHETSMNSSELVSWQQLWEFGSQHPVGITCRFLKVALNISQVLHRTGIFTIHLPYIFK